MNIPDKIKVGGKVYTVTVTNRLDMGPDYSAEILYSQQEINLRPAAPEAQEASLLHELFHAMLAHLGYQEHDEKLVEGLANTLHMIAKDNPGLFSEPLTAPQGVKPCEGTRAPVEAEEPAGRGGCTRERSMW